MAELKPKGKVNIDEYMTDCFGRAIYMSKEMPFYSDKYPSYRFLPKNVKKDMRRLGLAAYREYLNMCEEYADSKAIDAWNKRS